MGLDMYVIGRRYISGWRDPKESELRQTIAELFPELAANQLAGAVRSVEIEAGYWRKANAIHDWFVKNCQNGVDDCGQYVVDRVQLEELRSLCLKILDFGHLATELLPPREGFFFGDTQINQSYFDDLRQTVNIVDRCLALGDDWILEYHSSW